MPKLSLKEINNKCQPDQFNFTSTAELKPLDDIIGQERAVKAMNFGLRIKNKGYNIYMAGLTGTGKTSYARSLAAKVAAEGPVPDDWCYVFNFSEPDRPRAINFPAGDGQKFVYDMDGLIEEFRKEIPKVLESENFEGKKRDLWEQYQVESNKELKELDNWAKERGFSVQRSDKGVFMVPLIDGEPADREKLQSLPDEKAEEIQKKFPEVQKEMNRVLKKIRELEKETIEKIRELEKEVVLSVVNSDIEELKEKYGENKKVVDYLEAVKEDIIENYDSFKIKDVEENPFAQFMPAAREEDFFRRYKVNLFVNNCNQKSAPLVMETNPTYYNLFGKIEGKAQFGTVTTNFMNIKSGAVHRANGGFLIIQALDILKEPISWDSLKRMLQNEEACVENISEHYTLFPTTTLKPEPIPVNVKIILIGSSLIQELLFKYDDDFRKLFKIKAHFDVEMEKTEENMVKFASFIASMCQREGLPHFDRSGVARMVDFSSKMAEDREKMSTRFNEVAEIIFEASALAGFEGSEFVTGEHVERAISEKIYRSNLAEEKVQEMITTGHILVDTEGKVVGQVNGLSVYMLGDYAFGRPSRITARTYMGKSGIVNIEREAKMSGKIHDKGVLILAGYLGEQYARKKPLTLTASLCFEQNYGGIDGDSASCAELVALLSSIGEIPVKQGIAITGSLNQKGEIQPIGGVNEKIEGFYDVCKEKGLNGSQGVIIPAQNVRNLILKDEVLEAVEKGEFSIYAVKNVDEVLEIMTDLTAAEVHETINEKLEELAKEAKEFEKKDDKDDKEKKECGGC